MQKEPMETDGSYRCWLSQDEQERLIRHLEERPERQLAVRAMLHGLRSDELRWVRTSGLRPLQTEMQAYKLQVRDGKTGYREAPISMEMKRSMTMLQNAQGKRQDEPLIDAAKRTVRRWVTDAGEDLAEQTGYEDWQYISPHDLRRSWATTTYYAMDNHYAKEIIMRWGGWQDENTFQNNYLGRETDSMAADMMQQVGIL
jgi:integrase